MTLRISPFVAGIIVCVFAYSVHAEMVITGIANPTGGSGLGNLDFVLMAGSGNLNNKKGSFNGDDGNDNLPSGGGPNNPDFFAESFVTTAGEIKAFYDLNFATNKPNEIVLFLNLNESGPGSLINTLQKVEVYSNPSSIQGSPNPLGDVSSLQQVGIQQTFSGGIKQNDLNGPVNLPTINNGQGRADYAIFTGLNPYSFADNTVLLFNISMSNLDSGAESIFLSGKLAPNDIVATPEPTSILLFGTLVSTCFFRRRRQK